MFKTLWLDWHSPLQLKLTPLTPALSAPATLAFLQASGFAGLQAVVGTVSRLFPLAGTLLLPPMSSCLSSSSGVLSSAKPFLTDQIYLIQTLTELSISPSSTTAIFHLLAQLMCSHSLSFLWSVSLIRTGNVSCFVPHDIPSTQNSAWYLNIYWISS